VTSHPLALPIPFVWGEGGGGFDNMAATTWKVGGCDQETGINTECSNMKHKQNILHSESVKLNGLVSTEYLIEFRLDFDQLQSYTICLPGCMSETLCCP
jgi:hypothetical protein